MPFESALRRATFREGNWVRMADGQEWSFPYPPSPGVDPEYDAIARALHESEDKDEALRIELALAILLVSQNYVLSETEYNEIFNFGNDRAGLSAAQSAFHEMLASGPGQKRRASSSEGASFGAQISRSNPRQSWLSACATRVRSLLP